VDSDIADAMQWMLEKVVSGGTGTGASLGGRPVSGKTGTSENGRDLWFIGSIPQLTTGLWLGYDNNRSTGSTSVLATYAWSDYMARIVKDLPVRPFPPKPVLTGKFRPRDQGQASRPWGRSQESEQREPERRWEPAAEQSGRPSEAVPDPVVLPEPMPTKPESTPAPAAPAPTPGPAAPAPVAPPPPLTPAAPPVAPPPLP
jgi:penicillin-binding protein 1A